MDEKWYVVKTRSRHEQVATDMLRRKSFTIFFPEVSSWSKRKDRKKLIKRPLFPGYLFVHFELSNERWLEIKKTHGVVDLIKLHDEPEPIPEEQVLSIKAVVESGITITNRPYLNKGDKVLVTNGPLKGAFGIFIRAEDKKGKLVVSVDLLNRSLEVEIDEADAERF